MARNHLTSDDMPWHFLEKSRNKWSSRDLKIFGNKWKLAEIKGFLRELTWQEKMFFIDKFKNNQIKFFSDSAREKN
jgi:hypothetical protein